MIFLLTILSPASGTGPSSQLLEGAMGTECTWVPALVCTVLRAWGCAHLPGGCSGTGNNSAGLSGLGRTKGVRAAAAPRKAPWEAELVLFATHKSI